jgi:hypothetical protein
MEEGTGLNLHYFSGVVFRIVKELEIEPSL